MDHALDALEKEISGVEAQLAEVEEQLGGLVGVEDSHLVVHRVCLKQTLKKLEDLYEEYFEWIMARGSTTGDLLRHSGSAGREFDPTDYG